MAKVDEKEGSTGLAPGTLIDGRYKVVRFIGQGGNGQVHEVEHVLTGRHLALKSLHDETAYGRLEQEARATSLMKNGHAVKITDMGTNAGSSPYIVMELLEGQSLRTLLDDTGQLPLELTINISLQVAECLAEAHQHGIIHRDLKPDNVYLCQATGAGQYDVKVLDFGVVKISSDGPIPNSSLTRTGSTVGTPFYMSLEQLRNSSAVDQRTDIYALGVVLYEALSGRKPYQAETIGDLVYALCSGPPTQLGRLRPDLPSAACDVIMRALSSNRDERQPTMIEVAAQLLPFGDAAYGVWLRQGESKRRPGDASSRISQRVAKGSLTPSGVKPGLPGEPAAPSKPPEQAGGTSAPGAMATAQPAAEPAVAPAPAVPRPAAGAPPPRAEADEAWDRRQADVPVETERRSGADRREQQLPVSHDRRQRPAVPERDGDRDTPTEMYVKGVHGVATPPTPSSVPPMNRAATGAPRPERPNIDISGDRDTPTRAMEVMSPKVEERMPSGAEDFLLTQPLRNPTAQPPVVAPPPAPDPRGSFPSNPFGVPQVGSTQASGAHPAMSTDSSSAFPGLRPRWQEGLDRALIKVGTFIERMVQGAAHRFRAASPRAQIVIVVAAASLFAAIVVLTIWLLMG